MFQNVNILDKTNGVHNEISHLGMLVIIPFENSYPHLLSKSLEINLHKKTS
jgi:hypothetical protein